MKTFSTMALAASLAAGAFSAQAAPQIDGELDLCKAELRAYYGEETELNLVDQRRHAYGTRMRVAVRLDADNAYFATCWVPRWEDASFGNVDGRPELASTDPIH